MEEIHFAVAALITLHNIKCHIREPLSLRTAETKSAGKQGAFSFPTLPKEWGQNRQINCNLP